MFNTLRSILDTLLSSLQPQASVMSFFKAEYKSDAKYAYEYFVTTGKLYYYY